MYCNIADYFFTELSWPWMHNSKSLSYEGVVLILHICSRRRWERMCSCSKIGCWTRTHYPSSVRNTGTAGHQNETSSVLLREGLEAPLVVIPVVMAMTGIMPLPHQAGNGNIENIAAIRIVSGGFWGKFRMNWRGSGKAGKEKWKRWLKDYTSRRPSSKTLRKTN